MLFDDFSHSFFLYLSLSLFLLPLLFNLLLSLPDSLSNILKVYFHIDIMSMEWCKQLVSQCLDLIADPSHLLGESLINLSHLRLNIIP